MFKSLLALFLSSSFAFDPSILMISNNSYAQKKSENILQWKPITVQKGFVLSTDLYNKQQCLKIWPKQIPTFKEMNPHIKDVDKFYPGDQINIQVCDQEETPVPPPVVKKKKKKAPPVPKVEEVIPAVPEYVAEEKVEIKEEAEEAVDGNLYVGLGFLSESHNDLARTSPSFTFRVRSGFHPSLNHRLMIDAASDVIYVRNKIDFKTKPSKYQYFLSVGMGNRIGLTKDDLDRKMSNNITSYAEGSLGFNLRYSESINITMEVGATVNSKYPTNFSVMATKKLGNSPFYLGGYFDYVWTDSSLLETDTNDRRLITGGIVFSY